ncbi:fimbrillin family protein [Alistipes sp.]|uniref:fimbrillin family protein n=1 Tax=Alistipes sp. TaxID=1872444 RepID=UPI003A89B0DC
MKKSMFFVAGAALALASCSKDEPVSTNNGNAIDFRAAMQTRAAETTTANIAKFFVTALDKNSANYFTNAEFTKDGSFFTSTPSYYWPSDGSELNFYAYAPSAAELGGTLVISKNAKMLGNFAPAAAIADQKDFITAAATGSKSNESTGVALTFEHRLAQIEIKAKNANDGYKFKVQGVRIGKPVSKGAFDFETSAWTLGTNKTNYAVTYEGSEKSLGAAAVSIMAEENDNAMLLPQQLTAWDSENDKKNDAEGAYLAVKVQIRTKDGARVFPAASVGEYDWVAVAIDTKWDAGKKYVYTLDFTNGAGKVDPEKPEPTDPTDPDNPGEDIFGGAIKFTVSVSAWVNAAEDIEM